MPEHGKVDSKSESELLLLVEGVNDCHAVFQLMWLVYRADPVFGIHECGNDDKFSTVLLPGLSAHAQDRKY